LVALQLPAFNARSRQKRKVGDGILVALNALVCPRPGDRVQQSLQATTQLGDSRPISTDLQLPTTPTPFKNDSYVVESPIESPTQLSQHFHDSDKVREIGVNPDYIQLP